MLGNAAAAAVLAVLAAALSYFVRAPAVRHAAWVLVLLKLVTPPVVGLPLPVLPAAWAPQPRQAQEMTNDGMTNDEGEFCHSVIRHSSFPQSASALTWADGLRLA